MTKPDGGPAYPCHIYGVEYRGMTVRQRYAKAVMQGIYSGPDVLGRLTPGGSSEARRQIAEHAFAQADAMIATEDKEEEPNDG